MRGSRVGKAAVYAFAGIGFVLTSGLVALLVDSEVAHRRQTAEVNRRERVRERVRVAMGQDTPTPTSKPTPAPDPAPEPGLTREEPTE